MKYIYGFGGVLFTIGAAIFTDNLRVQIFFTAIGILWYICAVAEEIVERIKNK